MAKLQRQVGATSLIVLIEVFNTSGNPLTGLVFNSSGLTYYYKRNTGGSSTAVTLATATLGTFASGGFKEVDATNMPGLYEVGIPNAALASSADSVVICLQGASTMAAVLLEIELTATNNQDGVHFGITGIPNAAAGANGGLPTGDASGRVTVVPGQFVVKKNQALANFGFVMYDSNGNPATGLTVSCQRAIDGGGFGACTNSPATELSNGWYLISLSAADLNGNVILFRATAGGAQDTDKTILTQP